MDYINNSVQCTSFLIQSNLSITYCFYNVDDGWTKSHVGFTILVACYGLFPMETLLLGIGLNQDPLYILFHQLTSLGDTYPALSFVARAALFIGYCELYRQASFMIETVFILWSNIYEILHDLSLRVESGGGANVLLKYQHLILAYQILGPVFEAVFMLGLTGMFWFYTGYFWFLIRYFEYLSPVTFILMVIDATLSFAFADNILRVIADLRELSVTILSRCKQNSFRFSRQQSRVKTKNEIAEVKAIIAMRGIQVKFNDLVINKGFVDSFVENFRDRVVDALLLF